MQRPCETASPLEIRYLSVSHRPESPCSWRSPFAIFISTAGKRVFSAGCHIFLFNIVISSSSLFFFLHYLLHIYIPSTHRFYSSPCLVLELNSILTLSLSLSRSASSIVYLAESNWPYRVLQIPPTTRVFPSSPCILFCEASSATLLYPYRFN